MSKSTINHIVRPPIGLKQLDALAWCIGRDDRAQGRLPVRAAFYRPDKARHYLAWYESQSPDSTTTRKDSQ